MITKKKTSKEEVAKNIERTNAIFASIREGLEKIREANKEELED